MLKNNHRKEQGMNTQFDVIVIGAGNAGLSAGVTTAKHGLKTLVLEQHNLPGGSATSFRRGRFEFEPSLHELAEIGSPEKPGSVRKLLESYGVEIDWYLEDNLFRAIAKGPDGYDVTMPADAEAYCDEMERQVPGSRNSVEAVLELANKALAALDYLSESKGHPDPKVMATEHADFMRIASHSLQEVLDALGMPKKAQYIFCTQWGYLGATPDQIDFLHYVLMLDSYLKLKPAVPYMRSHEISLALVKALRDNGGEIWYNCKAENIIVENGRACGVVARGREIRAKHVISNWFPDFALANLKGGEAPERTLKLINARKHGRTYVTMYLGLNRSAEELGIKDYSTFIMPSPDPKEQWKASYTGNRTVVVNCLNTVIPDSSPEGTCTLFFTAGFPPETWVNVKPEEYKKKKNEIAEKMITLYEETLGITIKPYIEEISVATPITFARYLNTPHGTPYGYQIAPWDTMIVRIMNMNNEQVMPGLRFCGAHGERADGYSETYIQGNTAGMLTVKDAKEGK
jgi:phytoene dehydrogenase-like protein